MIVLHMSWQNAAEEAVSLAARAVGHAVTQKTYIEKSKNQITMTGTSIV